MRDRTAQTGPLTVGQQIVAWWETTTSASEPADLADKIDVAIAAERERCAKAVEAVGEWVTSGPPGSAVARPSHYKDFAAAIRARKT